MSGKVRYSEHFIIIIIISLLVDHIPTFSVEKNVSIVYPDYTSVTASFSQWNLESQPWLVNCAPQINYSNLQ